jgi:hypothetical protein
MENNSAGRSASLALKSIATSLKSIVGVILLTRAFPKNSVIVVPI